MNDKPGPIQAKRLKRAVRVAVGFVFVIAGASVFAETGSEQDEKAIASRLAELVGREARLCGLVKHKASFRSAWDCAKAQDKARTSFWLAVEQQPVDSRVWYIIARSKDGRRYWIFYTSNDSGQPEFVPSFTVSECARTFTDENLFTPWCERGESQR